MLNIVLFGAPGTGKGTQSQNIINKYHLIHLSTGDIMREEIRNGTEIGKLAKEYIDKGLLVPDSIILKQLYHKATSFARPNGFIFDGFPRTLPQAETLDKMMNKKNIPLSMVIYLKVTEDELFKRILSRSQHSNRDDDNVEVIKKRLEVYRKQTEPLLEYYDKQNKLVTIDGMGTIEEVFGNISKEIDQYIEKNNLILY